MNVMNHSEVLRRSAVELQTRRFFLKTSMACVGGMAFNALLSRAFANENSPVKGPRTHFPAKAKRVIYIHLEIGRAHV